MCYFLCFSIPSKVPDISAMFGDIFSLEEASSTSIGQATSGNRKNRPVYVLTQNGCSCSVIGKPHTKTKNDSQLFMEGIQKLLGQVCSVSVLVHVCHDIWRSERVDVKYKKTVSIEALMIGFANIEEDVRYIITIDS